MNRYVLKICYSEHPGEWPVQIDLDGEIIGAKTLRSCLQKVMLEIEAKEYKKEGSV